MVPLLGLPTHVTDAVHLSLWPHNLSSLKMFTHSEVVSDLQLLTVLGKRRGHGFFINCLLSKHISLP